MVKHGFDLVVLSPLSGTATPTDPSDWHGGAESAAPY